MTNLQTTKILTEEKEGVTSGPCSEKKHSSNPLRLLVGKLVFLDLTVNYKPINKIKECLSLIEAVIFTFAIKLPSTVTYVSWQLFQMQKT